jgi:hypothetical protein
MNPVQSMLGGRLSDMCGGPSRDVNRSLNCATLNLLQHVVSLCSASASQQRFAATRATMAGSFFAQFVPGTIQPRPSLLIRTGAFELTRAIAGTGTRLPGFNRSSSLCRHHGV